MTAEPDEWFLRIYCSQSDRERGQTVYRRIIEAMQQLGFPGATVFLGCEGFGPHGRISSDATIDAMADLPVMLQAVASRDHIRAIAIELERFRASILITVAATSASRYESAGSA
jgi:PII-like signaling protein